VAKRYGIGHVTTDLAEALAQPGVEAAILCTPTPLHAAQTIQCLNAGKHVQGEIPLADRWTDATFGTKCLNYLIYWRSQGDSNPGYRRERVSRRPSPSMRVCTKRQ
jgi:hypothetical protein